MTKEELKKMERGHEILNDIEELEKRLTDVEYKLDNGTIVKGALAVRDDFNDIRVPLSAQLSTLLLKIVKHSLKNEISKLEKEFEEL